MAFGGREPAPTRPHLDRGLRGAQDRVGGQQRKVKANAEETAEEVVNHRKRESITDVQTA
jgi:hypothetical protein